jgi:prepilin-type N-terminal cleavage/methylation domain-containing protein
MIVDNVREYNKNAFTLIEMLIALIVSSLILTVVATLAFAMTTAIDSNDDTAEKQAAVRYTTLKISELIRQCKLVCSKSDQDLAIWKSDDNGDGKIDITELFYIEMGSNGKYIQLLDFSNVPKWFPAWLKNPNLSTIQSSWYKAVLKLYCQKRYTVLVEQCSNVQLLLDEDPPETEFVSMSFTLIEDNVSHQYQISASLRNRAGHLLDSDGYIVSDDD